MSVTRIRKALAAAIAAGFAAYTAGAADGTVTARDWAWVIGWTIVSGVVTWWVPNRPADAPGDAGTAR